MPTSTTESAGFGTGGPDLARVVLVTGSSRGIGQAVAHRLAANEIHVVVHGSSEASAKQAAENLGDDVLAVHADVSDPAQVKAAYRQVFERYRRLDALVVDAGTPRPDCSG